MSKRTWIALALIVAVVVALAWLTRPAAAPERPTAPRWPGFTPAPPAPDRPPRADPQPAGPLPTPTPAPSTPVPRGRPLDPNKVLESIRDVTHHTPQRSAVGTGTLVGVVTGLRPGESGGAFAMKGDYTFANVTEDDLYDFGGWADSEARVGADGTFTMKELEAGHYSVIAFSMRGVGTASAEFHYVQGSADVVAGKLVRITLSLD